MTSRRPERVTISVSPVVYSYHPSVAAYRQGNVPGGAGLLCVMGVVEKNGLQWMQAFAWLTAVDCYHWWDTAVISEVLYLVNKRLVCHGKLSLAGAQEEVRQNA